MFRNASPWSPTIALSPPADATLVPKLRDTRLNLDEITLHNREYQGYSLLVTDSLPQHRSCCNSYTHLLVSLTWWRKLTSSKTISTYQAAANTYSTYTRPYTYTYNIAHQYYCQSCVCVLQTLGSLVTWLEELVWAIVQNSVTTVCMNHCRNTPACFAGGR